MTTMTTADPRPTTRLHLEVLTVEQPCPADFAAMSAVDGDRVRHCRHCDQHVYDLSAMTRAAAEALVADHLDRGGPMCIRMVRRADGTVTTADCRGRWRAAASRWAKRWAGPVGAALSLVLAAIGARADDQPAAVMGAMRPPPATQPTTKPSTQPTTRPDKTHLPAMGRVVLPRPNK
jgi:hypothetical protein